MGNSNVAVEKDRKLLDQIRDAMRLRYYSHRSEQSYVSVG